VRAGFDFAAILGPERQVHSDFDEISYIATEDRAIGLIAVQAASVPRCRW